VNAVLQAQEPSARYLAGVQPTLVRQFELLATAPGGVGRLRELILSLAVQGKLVPQDSRDEPAFALLKRIAEKRTRLIGTGKLRQSKDLIADDASEPPYSLPQGWAWSKLATIGVINPRNEATDDVVASFVQMSSIPVAFSDPHATEARPWHDIKSGFTQFAEGDVGVAKITPCFENGKSTVFENLSNGIGAGTTELHIVRPLCGVVPRYVLLFLKSPGFLRSGEATMTGTAGQKRLPRAFFEGCPFPLPPLAEQSRIVVRVDELMRLCDALETKGRLEAEQHARLLGTLLGTLTDSSTPEELAANWQRVADHFDLLLDRPEAVDALEQTILQLGVRGLLVQQDPSDEPASALREHMRRERNSLDRKSVPNRGQAEGALEGDQEFPLPRGWEWLCVADLLPEFQNGVASRGDKGGLPVTVLRLADIKARRISLVDTRQIQIAERDIDKYRLRSGDILITRVNGSADIVGQFNLCEEDVDAIYCDHFIRMRVSDEWLDPAFAAVLGESDLIRKRISGLFITTAGQKTVNQGHIGSLRFALPPLAEQARIVARVTELRRLCADLRQRLTASQTTQSYLAEALVSQSAA
jgi:type I restriction enzyme S subunit